MAKVYVVTQGKYSDFTISAMFSSMRLAEDYIHTTMQNNDFKPEYSAIQTWELDEPEANWFTTYVNINRDGKVLGIYTAISSIQRETREPVQSFAQDYRGVYLHIAVRTSDKKRAIKIANEHRTALLAADIWGDKAQLETFTNYPTT